MFHNNFGTNVRHLIYRKYLSTHDLASISSVSTFCRADIKRYIESRVKADFKQTIPTHISHTSFYHQLWVKHNEENEQQIVVAYVAACLGIMMGSVRVIEYPENARQQKKSILHSCSTSLDAKLPTLPLKEFVDFANEMIARLEQDFRLKDLQSFTLKVYIRLIHASVIDNDILSSLLKELGFVAPEYREFQAIVSQNILKSLIKCDATLALKTLLHKIPDRIRATLLNRFGNCLCTQAVDQNKPGIIALLFKFGLEEKSLLTPLLGKVSSMLLGNDDSTPSAGEPATKHMKYTNE